MQVAFEKNTLAYLQRVAWETKCEEYTQEVKVPDAMPDAANVLGAWGQPVLRSKSWHGNGMTATGGVLIWILYVPENETVPKVIESWLPFQFRWDFAQNQQDGTILIRTLLQTLDVRAVTPRKLMLRCVVSAVGEGLVPDSAQLYTPVELPEDVHILRNQYPILLPREAGEKVFSVEEDLELPPGCSNADDLMYYSLQPQITDQKLMANKLVLRGSLKVTGLCCCESQRLEPFSLEVPFSQYMQLQQSYGEDGEIMILPEIGNGELELGEKGFHLKTDIVAQYVIADRPVVEVVEDVYSLTRTVTPQYQELELPVILDNRQTVLRAEGILDAEAHKIICSEMCMGHPTLQRQGDTVGLQQTVSVQTLWQNENGVLSRAEANCSANMELDTEVETRILAWSQPAASAKVTVMPGQLQMMGEVTVHTLAVTQEKQAAIIALELGQPIPPDPDKPSLILRRAGADSLWQIAKKCASTVEDIRTANGLTEEPDPEMLLVIPVLQH